MSSLRPRLAAHLREYNIKKALRDAIARGDVATYVARRYRELALTVGERDELVSLFRNVQLPQATAAPVSRGSRSRG